MQPTKDAIETQRWEGEWGGSAHFQLAALFCSRGGQTLQSKEFCRKTVIVQDQSPLPRMLTSPHEAEERRAFKHSSDNESSHSRLLAAGGALCVDGQLHIQLGFMSGRCSACVRLSPSARLLFYSQEPTVRLPGCFLDIQRGISLHKPVEILILHSPAEFMCFLSCWRQSLRSILWFHDSVIYKYISNAFLSPVSPFQCFFGLNFHPTMPMATLDGLLGCVVGLPLRSWALIFMGLFQLEMFYDSMTHIPLVVALDPRALIRQSKSEAANSQVHYTISVLPHKINHSPNLLSEFNLSLNFILLWAPECTKFYTRKCYPKVTQHWT